MGKLENWVEKQWYQGNPSGWMSALKPLSMLVSMEARRRLKRFHRRREIPPVPVLVVGNITVGGTGKTPLVIALVEAAHQRGMTVAVISRGYGGTTTDYPQVVRADSNALEVGDEPVLIARRTGAPVILNPDRRAALDYAIERFNPQLVISDDGLQHYALPRSAEVVVIDGQRGLGNGQCLPAGPLREPAERLKEVDFLISTGGGWAGAHPMLMHPAGVAPVGGGEVQDLVAFQRRAPLVHAVAGIGNPKRFFNLLNLLGFSIKPHVFPDHHAYRAEELHFGDDLPVLMTEKDAVKCAPFAEPNWWALPVEARLPDGLVEQMLDRALNGETA